MKSTPKVIVAARVVEFIEWPIVVNSNLRYVYVLQCQETKNFKVGVADDVERRHREIQAMSPTKLALIYCFIAESEKFERYIHRKLEKFRMHGEWFKADPEAFEALEHLQAAYDDACERAEALSEQEKQRICSDAAFEKWRTELQALCASIPEDADLTPYLELLRRAIEQLEQRQRDFQARAQLATH